MAAVICLQDSYSQFLEFVAKHASSDLAVEHASSDLAVEHASSDLAVKPSSSEQISRTHKRQGRASTGASIPCQPPEQSTGTCVILACRHRHCQHLPACLPRQRESPCAAACACMYM
jgi:hypothetical protein